MGVSQFSWETPTRSWIRPLYWRRRWDLPALAEGQGTQDQGLENPCTRGRRSRRFAPLFVRGSGRAEFAFVPRPLTVFK